MIDREEVFRAKQRLNAFLEANPKLMPMQKIIEQRLSGAGSQHNRLVILKMMIDENLVELRNALKGLLDVRKD
jgi:lipopolysaccharide biosynthesis regulator YciM